MSNLSFLISHQSLFTFACVQIRHNPLSGGYCGGVPPLPIPNREVKPTCADGTAMQCGRVGRRLLSMKSLRFRKISEAFLFFSSRGSFSFPLGLFFIGGSSSSFFLHRDFTDESDGNLAYRITHGFLRIFGRWPMARARNELLLFFVTQISQMTQIFSYRLFCPTDFTDLHRFSLVLSLSSIISIFRRF